jgi:hypothetical protein
MRFLVVLALISIVYASSLAELMKLMDKEVQSLGDDYRCSRSIPEIIEKCGDNDSTPCWNEYYKHCGPSWAEKLAGKACQAVSKAAVKACSALINPELVTDCKIRAIYMC